MFVGYIKLFLCSVRFSKYILYLESGVFSFCRTGQLLPKSTLRFVFIDLVHGPVVEVTRMKNGTNIECVMDQRKLVTS